jgi:hypothetical protein
VPNQYASGAKASAIADLDTFYNNRPCTNMTARADVHVAAQGCAGRDMGACADPAVMIDRGAGVYNAAPTNTGARLHNGTGHDLHPGLKMGVWRDMRERMNQRREAVSPRTPVPVKAHTDDPARRSAQTVQQNDVAGGVFQNGLIRAKRWNAKPGFTSR